MNITDEKLMTMAEVTRLLNISAVTLRRWDRNGRLKSLRTVGNHRRWKESDVRRFIGEEFLSERSNRRLSVVVYARCSSTEQKQRGDIDRQSQRIVEYAVKKGYHIEEIIKDCGSGLNDRRKGFKKLLQTVISGKVDKVIIENKDRLTRFGYDTLVFMFRQHNVEIELTSAQPKTEYDELANDLMMLIASFSGKLYRKRALERNKQI